jgi:hypothetical protein
MSGYIGNIPTPQATQTRDTFTATSGQTSFATSGYTPGFLDVYLNGVHLVNGTDYTASNGSDVVLTTNATTGDNLEVVSYSTYEVNAQTYTGGLTAKNDGAAAITANRLSSDGTVVDMQRSGSSFGSLGVLSGFPYIGGGDTGMLFVNADDTIRPHNITTNVARDNAIDLGESTVRWKNLYLSGGVYLGGTGSANLLDDYEEGTWTPVFSSNFGVVTYSGQHGYYTKVGRIVTANFHLGWTARSTSGGGYGVSVENLPFVAPNLAPRATGGVLAVSGFENIPMGAGLDSRTHGGGYMNTNTNSFSLRFSSLSASEVSPDGSSGTYTGSGYYYGFVQYWVS